jgi:hypothetical protein
MNNPVLKTVSWLSRKNCLNREFVSSSPKHPALSSKQDQNHVFGLRQKWQPCKHQVAAAEGMGYIASPVEGTTDADCIFFTEMMLLF